MFETLPPTAETFGTWTWSQIAPYYDDLLARPLTAATVDGWLRDWTRLGELVDEASVRFTIRTTTNTADTQAEREYTTFLKETTPQILAAEQRVKTHLIESGLEPPYFELPLRKLRTDAALFREANVSLISEERKLSLEYDKISGARTVTWDGEERPLIQLYPVLQEPDRARREHAWRTMHTRNLQDTPALTELWRELMRTRRAIAANSGFSTYLDYRWQELYRYDYTPADARAFHDAIAEVIVPAASRIQERRRRRLGLDMLRPWDLACDPAGRPPLLPAKSLDELQDGISRIFQQVSPRFAGYFEIMRREHLLDLESRPNKASGGYSLCLNAIHKPFIFTNSLGTHGDVEVLLHEGGHAFNSFEMAPLPYLQQRLEQMLPAEFAEVASTAMEYLGSPYLAASKGGFYSEADAARARIKHLEDAIIFFPYMAMTDALQHWMYEHAGQASDLAACDATFAALVDRFQPAVNWSGLDAEQRAQWHLQLHVFQSPFYYIEYGIAQLGALQVFANARRDQASAVEAYRQALSLGGTKSLPELFTTAGARFAFDVPALRAALSLVEEVIGELEPVARD
jgi:oligoendopeptidase F